MAMRLHELHPALSHYPLAALPAAVKLEAAAQWTGRQDLNTMSRWAMPVAAVTSAVTAAAGLIAQQEVSASDEGWSMLSKHRSLNLGAVGAMTALGAYRLSRRRVGPGYLAAGAVVLGTMTYSAYLGGRMVYGQGMGVERAGGVRDEQSPSLTLSNVGTVIKTAGRQLKEAVGGLIKGFGGMSTGFGPDKDELQRDIERDNAGSGALPMGSAQRPI